MHIIIIIIIIECDGCIHVHVIHKPFMWGSLRLSPKRRYLGEGPGMQLVIVMMFIVYWFEFVHSNLYIHVHVHVHVN